MHANSNERARITTRVTAHAHQTIEKAAEMTATTTNQFVAQAALREAERIIEEHSVIRLGQADMKRFVEALDHPTPISERLAVSLKQHLETRQDDTGSSRSTVRWTPKPR